MIVKTGREEEINETVKQEEYREQISVNIQE